MDLEGQGSRRGERGYAMAALLVSLGVMAVLMSAALPVWKHQAQREKEAELIFRGTQYARAIQLYQRKNGQGNLPPTVDVLVQQRFLRKKYKDPMVEDGEFQLLYAGQQAGQPSGQGRQSTGRGGSGPQNPPSGFSGGSVGGGILGVVSKSKDTSIKLYLGRTHYNEWQFIVQSVNPNLGGGTGGRGGNGRQGPGGINGPGGLPGAGGGPGGRGIGPGGRGNGGRGTGGGTPVGPGGSGRRGGQ